jgi:hypothetical protein
VWWVSPNGVGNGTSRDHPLGSLSAGINAGIHVDWLDVNISCMHAAAPGDIVIALPGNYSGPLNTNLGFAGKAITLKSEFSYDVDIRMT